MENNSSDDPASRKRWAVGSCNTVLGVLGNADIISTGSVATAERPDLISGTTTQICTMVLQCFFLFMYHGKTLCHVNVVVYEYGSYLAAWFYQFFPSLHHGTTTVLFCIYGNADIFLFFSLQNISKISIIDKMTCEQCQFLHSLIVLQRSRVWRPSRDE